VAEVRYLTSRSYEWVVEGDIKACFDEISHSALMDRVRKRVGDKRILALVKAFLSLSFNPLVLGLSGGGVSSRHGTATA
jgi:retron-type reverse transcriptase